MDYEKLNKLTKEIYILRNREAVHKTEPEYEGAPYEEVYDINHEDGLFLKLYISTDSYGDNDTIEGFEFVKAKAKTVTIYEY